MRIFLLGSLENGNCFFNEVIKGMKGYVEYCLSNNTENQLVISD